MSDPAKVLIEMEIDATLSQLEADDKNDILYNPRARLYRLVKTCTRYATEQSQEQPQKRIVSFSDACFRDPEQMIDSVNTRVNRWLEDGGIIIRDAQLIPQTSVAVNEKNMTVFFYTVSVLFVEDVTDIPEENGGC